MRKWLPYLVLALVFVFLFTGTADAQCSQCKLLANAAETVDDSVLDYHKGNRINNAILYIMMAPYFLLGIGVFLLRKKIVAIYKNVFLKEN
ncbi:MAG: hypothetical protein WC994_04435 [Brumimicrobium sp.]